QVDCVPANVIGICGRPAGINSHVAADGPPRYCQSLQEGTDPSLIFGIIGCCGQKQSDTPYALAVLRAHRQRPRRRPAEQRYEVAPPDHSITSSASASSLSGIWRPSALAVLRLIFNSYLVGVCTGRSAGFSPLRIRST